jgi:hypothetical protein
MVAALVLVFLSFTLCLVPEKDGENKYEVLLLCVCGSICELNLAYRLIESDCFCSYNTCDHRESNGLKLVFFSFFAIRNGASLLYCSVKYTNMIHGLLGALSCSARG